MLTADRKRTAGALAALKAGVASRPGIPALTGVLVEAGDGRAVLTATDLEVSVRAELDAAGEPARFLIPFALFADAVKHGAGSEVTIDADESTARLGGASVRLLPVDDFPTLTASAPYVGTIDGASFAVGADAAGLAASKDEARPVLTGVLFELAGHLGRMVATDSYRLHVAEIDGAGDFRAIIPARVVKSVRKQLGRKPAGAVTVAGTDDEVRFKLPDGLEITSRTIQGEYPNWQQLVPERGIGTGVRYDQAELEAALKSVGLFARDTSPVRFELEAPSGLKLSASSPDLGTSSADLERVEIWGDPVTCAFNPVYFAGCVAAVGDGGTFELRDGLKPAVFRSADGRRTALVMPVRLPSPVG